MAFFENNLISVVELTQRVKSAFVRSNVNDLNAQIVADALVKAEIELTSGINEVYDLIVNNRIKNVNHKRYSNQNYLEEYGIK